MSYIINNTNPFISAKLTEKGRELLAKGQLTFGSWAIGDSEINYNRQAIVDANPLDAVLSQETKILRPKDEQPNIKYYINTGGSNPLVPLTNANIKTMKLVVNNEATQRGFFSADTSGYTTLIGAEYAKVTNLVPSSNFNGGNTVDIQITGATVGDLLLVKVGTTDFTNDSPKPHLWYKIQSIAGTVLTLDRTVPDLVIGGNSMIIVYQGGEVANGFGTGTTTAYWDTGTLAFDSSCDITREDVPIWNMNNVFAETLAGITGTSYENHTRFGSYEYLGQMSQYLEYGSDNATIISAPITTCDDITGVGVVDSFNKSVAILHYTNNTISNLYGEFFHIDNSNGKTVKLHLPDLMYHRREFSGGTASGTTMGMSFIASGATKMVGTSDIEYVDLIEDPIYLITRTPKAVGKVYPQLKIVVIENPELVAALSYKANRNWTLPELSINLANPSGGTSTGILQKDETMYITYGFEGGLSGLTTALPCQTYTRITNTLSTAKDVEFRISETDLFPYMRKVETAGASVGFYGYAFKVVYQVVTGSNRPDPNAWKVLDYTSTTITGGVGQSIDPKLLESQNSMFNNQVITTIKNSGATQFDITQPLSMAPVLSPDILQFGDERFFYGNLEAYIGATIYKTMFDIRINSGQFNKTSNPTRSSNVSTNPPAIRVSEVGIYDNNNNLVVIGKLSKPVKLVSGQTIMIELSMDF